MDSKQLFKILIAAAWIDGEIQPPERKYLHKIATEKGLLHDPEIKNLLLEAKPLSSKECHHWLQEYLGPHPKREDYQELIEALSGLIYSDGIVEVKEAQLLTFLQQLDPDLHTDCSFLDSILKIIGKFYRKAVYGRTESI